MSEVTPAGRERPHLVAAAIVAGALPATRTYVYNFGALPRVVPVVVAVVAAVAALAATDRWAARRLVCIPIAVLAGVVAGTGGGRIVAVWTVAWVLLAAWSCVARPPVPGPPDPDGSARIPHVGLALVGAASIALTDRDQLRVPILCLVAATFFAVQSSWPIPALRRVTGAITRLAAALGAGVSHAAMAVLWVVATVPTGVAQRLTGWRPEDRWRSAEVGWVRRSAAAEDPDRMWLPEPPSRHRPRAERIRGGLGAGLAAGLSLALVAALLVPVRVVASGTREALGPPPTTLPPPTLVEARMRAEPWWNAYDAESRASYETSYFSQYAGLELADVRGRYLNIRDRRRLTWAPEGCDPLLEVWMFGGSTLFGVGNRDLHTLPSALARIAAERGYGLAVANYGSPGDVAWQEQRRLERELLMGDERPDLVVFFDGFNDWATVGGLGVGQRDPTGDLIGPLDPVQMEALTRLQSLPGTERYVIDLSIDGGEVRPRAEVLAAARDQYAAAQEMATTVLGGLDVPFVRFLQPNLGTRAEAVEGEPPTTAEERADAEWFAARRPPGVVDLSAALDDWSVPAYNDWVHVDEAGNVPLAEAMVDELTSRLDELVAATGRGRCR